MGRPILRSCICEMLGREYPILLAGMGAKPGIDLPPKKWSRF